MAYDAAGNLYFVDALNNVVRVVASGKGTIPGVASPQQGRIYTVAGVQGNAYSCVPYNPNLSTDGGTVVNCGDGGPANQAYLNLSPTQSAVVAKAPLTVTATNQTLAQGVGLPSLNSAADYTFGQFQNQETAVVLTGAPSLVIVDGTGNVLTRRDTCSRHLHHSDRPRIARISELCI
jgi:hypothetical protein